MISLMITGAVDVLSNVLAGSISCRGSCRLREGCSIFFRFTCHCPGFADLVIKVFIVSV